MLQSSSMKTKLSRDVKKHSWPEHALTDLDEKIGVEEERLEHLK